MELVLLRHGRTEWNAIGRFQGQSDVPLDAVGRGQAAALAARLCDERFDYAYSSDLGRARVTAETVLAGSDVALLLDARWREMRFGDWEGLTWEEIVAQTPALQDADAVQPRAYVPPRGESFLDLCGRVSEALDQLRAGLPADARVLIVTHAGPLHALLSILALEPSQEHALRFQPASITRLRLDEAGRAVITSLNEAAGDG